MRKARSATIEVIESAEARHGFTPHPLSGGIRHITYKKIPQQGARFRFKLDEPTTDGSLAFSTTRIQRMRTEQVREDSGALRCIITHFQTKNTLYCLVTPIS